MCAALPNNHFLDLLPTDSAWAAGLLVDLEIVLKTTASIYPVDTGSVGFNPFGEDGADSVKQSCSILQVEGAAGLEGVDARLEQGFIRIDVSTSCQEVLIQQERFYGSIPGMQSGMETFSGQVWIIRFRSEFVKQRGCIVQQPDPAKLACVIEAQAPERSEIDQQTVVLCG